MPNTAAQQKRGRVFPLTIAEKYGNFRQYAAMRTAIRAFGQEVASQRSLELDEALGDICAMMLLTRDSKGEEP